MIVAAGGGSGSTCTIEVAGINPGGGSGGGYMGVNNSSNYATGASQTDTGTINSGHGNRGTFGLGANGYSSGSRCQSAGGGGGGWYGGVSNNYSGSGGSGYIGSSNLISSNGITKHMTCYNCTTSTATNTKTESNTCHSSTATADCAKEGAGYAKITYLGE